MKLAENWRRWLPWATVALLAMDCYAGNDGTSAVYRAVSSGDLKGLRALLEHGADPNDRIRYPVFGSGGLEGNHYPWDPDNGTTALMVASENGSVPIVTALLGAGADPNRETRIGKTALMFAAEKCHLNVMRLLLEKGSNIRAVATGGTNHLGADLSGSVLRFALHCALWKDGTSDVANFVLDRLKAGDISDYELSQCLDARHRNLSPELRARVERLRRW